MDNTIKVIIRFKQFQDETEEQVQISQPNQSTNWIIQEEAIIYKNQKQDDIYSFDTILPPVTLQYEVFDSIVLPKLEIFSQGYNSAVFAYGATSSGKTYTILGPETTINMLLMATNNYQIDTDAGILPRSFLQIIQYSNQIKEQDSVKSVQLKVSYVEIYNEAIYDLLNPQIVNKTRETEKRLDLKISNITDGPKLQGVKEVEVQNVSDLFELVALGTKARSVGVTQFNQRSSRSHVIFTIEMIVTWDDKSVRTSKMQFIDLAGSERLAKTVSTGQTLEETKKINQSLSCLGFCIMALSSKKQKHVPYRDSKLTTLLKECLGGNSNTSFICAVSPALEHDDKTIQTLKFAQRAKKIVNKVKLNLRLSYEQIESQLSKLKQELSMMETVLQKYGIPYDRQFIKDEAAKYQIQLSCSQDDININAMTEQYRRNLRRTQTSANKADIQDEFRLKFQQYLEQNLNSEQQSTRAHIQRSSLPLSLNTSEDLSGANSKEPLEVLQLDMESNNLFQLNSQIQQLQCSQDEILLTNQAFTLQDDNDSLSKQGKNTTINSSRARKIPIQLPQQVLIQDPPKKRETCCQIF